MVVAMIQSPFVRLFVLFAIAGADEDKLLPPLSLCLLALAKLLADDKDGASDSWMRHK